MEFVYWVYKLISQLVLIVPNCVSHMWASSTIWKAPDSLGLPFLLTGQLEKEGLWQIQDQTQFKVLNWRRQRSPTANPCDRQGDGAADGVWQRFWRCLGCQAHARGHSGHGGLRSEQDSHSLVPSQEGMTISTKLNKQDDFRSRWTSCDLNEN